MTRAEATEKILRAMTYGKVHVWSQVCTVELLEGTPTHESYTLLRDEMIGFGLIEVAKLISAGRDKTDFSQPEFVTLTTLGQFIKDNGGWLAHLERESQRAAQASAKDQLELDLAKSNLQSNRTHRRMSRFNIILTIINVALGLLNVWILLSGKK